MVCFSFFLDRSYWAAPDLHVNGVFFTDSLLWSTLLVIQMLVGVYHKDPSLSVSLPCFGLALERLVFFALK